MKMYETVICKRMALNMTQAEIAEICGVSTATISHFESGIPVSHSVTRNIKESIDEYIRRKPEVEKQLIYLTSNVLGLKYQTPQEQLRSLAYLNVQLGYSQQAVMNQMNKERYL